MKTFIVYNLDTGLPIAVGESIEAEWARFEAAEETQIRAENLIAEEVKFSDRKSTRLNSSHLKLSRMPSSA